jgi:two-component system, NarL family, nitrate/nitrite response regulator NarL
MVRHNQSTSTIIVGNRALFREGVAALLRQTPYKVIASAQQSSDLKDVRASAESRILIIIGVDDAGGNGSESATVENIKKFRSRFPNGTIVVIAETGGESSFQQIMRAAPDGYVANLASRDVLLKLLDVALADQQVIVLSRPTLSPASTTADEDYSIKRTTSGNGAASYDRQCLTFQSADRKDPQLSQREREVLTRLAEGDSNKQIAHLCNITESTVKVHLKAILRKITVHNRTQAAIWAIAKGYHVQAELVNQKSTPTSRIPHRSSVQGQTESANGKFLNRTGSSK